MDSVILLQGPNMNRLGLSRPEGYYGSRTMDEIHEHFASFAKERGVASEFFQSNHEGHLIDWLQERQDAVDAVIINPAGLTFYGDSLRQALVETSRPVGLVHMSNMWAREDVKSNPFRSQDLFADICTVYTAGLGWRGYTVVLQALIDRENDQAGSQ
jgi:3-dehydroquinate dehydratase-2